MDAAVRQATVKKSYIMRTVAMSSRAALRIRVLISVRSARMRAARSHDDRRLLANRIMHAPNHRYTSPTIPLMTKYVPTTAAAPKPILRPFRASHSLTFLKAAAARSGANA